MKRTPLIAVLGASLLSACGGGSDSSGTEPTSSAATVTLSGTAAKGLMANADVKVHPVAADGSVDLARELASDTTKADGTYTLSFAGTKDQPYVVRVSAKADGSTTHRDEVTGTDQQLPTGFAMRSLVVPETSGAVTTSASITPFSEMAVAAAAKATGGVNAANAAQAVSTVTQLLGFNPTKVTATSTGAASSDDEKKLAVMLTAVSQMASSGDLGCAGDDAGVKVKCVVDALGAAASTGSIKLESGSGDSATNVSAVLNSAVTTVLAKPELVGSISSTLLTTVAANLGCTTNCTAATTPSAAAAALAISGAKLLFTQLKSDWTALFSRGGASEIASGAVNIQAFKFDQAMRDVHVPVRTLLTDSGALLLGIDLYNDFKAGRTTTPSRGRAEGEVQNDNSADFSNSFGAAGCTLYQDATTQVTATLPENANFIGCGARYYLTRTYANNSFTTNEYRHGFTITPNGGGSFGWQTRARLRLTSANGAVLSNAALQTDAAGAPIAAFTGTVTTTMTGGSVTGFTMVGELAAGFEEAGTQLVNHKHAINLSGTRSFSATQPKDGSSSITGSLVAQDSSGATLSTLTVKQGSAKELPVSHDANGNEVAPGAATAVRTAGGMLSAVTLNLVFSNANAEFEGLFSLPTSAWDKSGTALQPTEVTLSGMLRNISNGVATEFLSGSFSAKSTGFASYNATAAYSATNSYTRSLSFVGQVTAPGRPLLALSLGAEQLMDSDDGTTQSMSLQYRSIVNGTPRLVVNVAGTRETGSSRVNRFTLTEASANLSMSWLDGAGTVDLVHGASRVVGSVNTGSGVVTFTDGSLVSLDVGL